MSQSTPSQSGGSDHDRKACCTCKRSLPLAAYSPGNLRATGRCRECVSAKNRAVNARNPEDRRARNRAYYEANGEAMRAASKRRWQENGERYRIRQRAWFEENKDRINTERREFKSANTYRSWVNRLRKHGLTPEDYWAILDAQGGGCRLCGSLDPGKAGGSKDRVFAVDHCHESGKVRGLLCHPCNRALGGFHDNPELLRRAADYVSGCC